jgi:hypothetical protein
LRWSVTDRLAENPTAEDIVEIFDEKCQTKNFFRRLDIYRTKEEMSKSLKLLTVVTMQYKTNTNVIEPQECESNLLSDLPSIQDGEQLNNGLQGKCLHHSFQYCILLMCSSLCLLSHNHSLQLCCACRKHG